MTTPGQDPLACLNNLDREVVNHLLEIGTEDATEVFYATVIYRDRFDGDLRAAQIAAMRIMKFLFDIGYIELLWDNHTLSDEHHRHTISIPREEGPGALELASEFKIRVPAPGQQPGRTLAYAATELGKRY